MGVPAKALLALCISCTPCVRLQATATTAGGGRASAPHPYVSVCDIAPEEPGCFVPIPRCDETDPDCGPVPMFEHDDCYQPGAPRVPTTVPTISLNRCSHDGECLTNSERSSCFHPRLLDPNLNLRGSWPFDWDTTRDDLLCGCVDGYCRPFTQ